MGFGAIKGQQQAIMRLQGYLNQDKLEGGFLFSGPEGVGKFLTAKTFARAINCDAAATAGDCCDVCSACVRMEKICYPDLHCIDCGEEEIRIEAIRQWQEQICLRPYEARKKVFIVNNAHNLNPVSANAFLKTLEEPPRDSVLILVTDKPSMLLKTILSRCRVVKFTALQRQALARILERDYGVEGQQVHFLSYFSEGRLGNALRLKDTDIIGCKNRVIDACTSPGAYLFDTLATKDRQEMRVYLNIIAGWMRDAYFAKAGIPAAELIHSDRSDAVDAYARAHTARELEEGIRTVSEFLLYLDQNVNVKLLLSNLKLYFQSTR